MSFRTLFTKGYRTFLDEHRDDADLWFFLHIPKTAGSSFRAELSGILTPNYNIHAYDKDLPGGDHQQRLNATVRAFVDASRRTRHRFVSGHVPVTMMRPIADAGLRPKLFTILRDPVARFVSDFRYQSTSQHPDHVAFRARYRAIEDYLAERGECDKMMRYLAPTPTASVAETADHVLDNFTFVGSMETYDASFRIMMALLGVERAPSVFLRKTSDGEATAVPMTPELDASIRAANARDVALYDTLMHRIRAVPDILAGKPYVGDRAPTVGFSRWRDVA